jgi:hypothetical protein
VQQIQAGKAAEASLRKVTEDISQLKEQLSDAESERESQSSLLERNNQLIEELKKAKQAREKEAADSKAAAERAEAAAKLALEKATKEREQRERLQKEKDEAVKRADDAAAAALKRAEVEAAAGVRAKADADRASLAVAQAKAEADAAAKHAADAAKRLHEAERAAAGQPNEAAPAAAAKPASAAKPAAAAAAKPAAAANGKKPLPLAITDLSQIPGRACCPGDPYDMSEYDMTGTAYVTLASGNDAARQVIVLVQALRDSNTRADKIVVMLSRGGMGSVECRGEDGGAWKRANGREHMHHCGGPDTIAEEIVSPQYLATLTKLGATLMVVDEIPSTPYTEAIPGGRATFWGMALNKLRVFNMTQFKKVIWMDGACGGPGSVRGGTTRLTRGTSTRHRRRALSPPHTAVHPSLPLPLPH